MKVIGFTVPEIVAKLCKPAKVYLVLSLISIIIYLISMSSVRETVLEAEPNQKDLQYYTATGLAIKMLFTVVWIYILNYICQFKYGKKIAWFIVLLPFFFMGLMFIGVLCAMSFIALQTKKAQDIKSTKDKDTKQTDRPGSIPGPVPKMAGPGPMATGPMATGPMATGPMATGPSPNAMPGGGSELLR